MGTTTFSGPIKAGPLRETTGTTVGTDVQNTGFVIMAQSARVDIVGPTATTTISTLPPGAQVTNVSFNEGNVMMLDVGVKALGAGIGSSTALIEVSC